MPSYKNMDKDTVLKAIEGSFGITKTVASRIGCDWETAERLINRWEETRKAWNAESEIVLDVAESRVIKGIMDGDTHLAKWMLKMKGQKRGYIEAPTISLSNGEPLNINFASVTRDQVQEAGNVEIGGIDEEGTE